MTQVYLHHCALQNIPTFSKCGDMQYLPLNSIIEFFQNFAKLAPEYSYARHEYQLSGLRWGRLEQPGGP
jgi:hypothetical protein